MLTGFSDPVQTTRVFLGRTGDDTVEVRTRDGQYDFEVRGAMDVWCLKETLLDDVYRVNGFPIEHDWTVIDIGAGFGDFTVLAAREAPNGRVLAFEPFPDSYQLLQENLRRNQVPNATASPAAITANAREVSLDFSTFEPLQVKSDATAVSGEGERVESIALGALLEREEIAQVDLLKLDCEGCEYEVLMESPPEVIARVERVVMEYHEPIDGKTHATLASYLRDQGFTVESTPNVVHPDEIGYLRASRYALEM